MLNKELKTMTQAKKLKEKKAVLANVQLDIACKEVLRDAILEQILILERE